MATFHDLTTEFKKATIDWTLSGVAFRSQFSKQVMGMRLGLYATIYANSSPMAIHDRNTKTKSCGKMIVKPNGNTLKYGKFQGGVAERHKQNHDHLHRCRGGRAVEQAHVCRDSLRLFLVLDLTNVQPPPGSRGVNAARYFETAHWNQPTRAYLEREGHADLTQARRSESRYIVGALPTKARLMNLLSDLGDGIGAAASSRRIP
jgi:hypothetical protein